MTRNNFSYCEKWKDQITFYNNGFEDIHSFKVTTCRIAQ